METLVRLDAVLIPLRRSDLGRPSTVDKPAGDSTSIAGPALRLGLPQTLATQRLLGTDQMSLLICPTIPSEWRAPCFNSIRFVINQVRELDPKSLEYSRLGNVNFVHRHPEIICNILCRDSINYKH